MTSSQLKSIATGKPEEGKNPVASFSTFLDRFKPQIALALPKHLNPDRMARLAVSVFSATPDLQRCEPQSIVSSIMTAAALGLEIGVNGQCYLIPYKKSRKVNGQWQETWMAQCVPGWKGLTDLVGRSGRATVWTGAVFEGDDFDYALGDRPFVRHRPGDETDPAKLTHVYAIGRVNGSDHPVIEVWSMRKIWKHRDSFNKVGASHYSFKNEEMYARKIPLLQVLKYMPSSVEVANALAVASAAETGQHAVIDGDYVTVSDVDQETGEIRGDGARTSAPAPSAQTTSAKPAATDEATYLQRIAACADLAGVSLLGDEIEELPAGELKSRLLAALTARDNDLAGQGK